jgi:hypothetical protein
VVLPRSKENIHLDFHVLEDDERSHFFRRLPLLLPSSDGHEALLEVRNYRVLAVALLAMPFCPAIARRQVLQVLLACLFLFMPGAVARNCAT